MGGHKVMDPTPSPSPVNTRVLVSISPFVRSVRLTTPEASPTQSNEQDASVTIDVTAADVHTELAHQRVPSRFGTRLVTGGM